MTTSLASGRSEIRRDCCCPVVPAAPRPKPNSSLLGRDRRRSRLRDAGHGTTSGYGEISSIDRNPQTHTTRVVATNDGALALSLGRGAQHEKITHEADDLHPE